MKLPRSRICERQLSLKVSTIIANVELINILLVLETNSATRNDVFQVVVSIFVLSATVQEMRNSAVISRCEARWQVPKP